MSDKIEEAREFLKIVRNAKGTAVRYMLLCDFGNGRNKTRYVLE